MFSYIVRRLLYVIPIIIGVMLITFLLFFVVQSPQTMAKNVLGKRATPETIQTWLENRGYDWVVDEFEASTESVATAGSA